MKKYQSGYDDHRVRQGALLVDDLSAPIAFGRFAGPAQRRQRQSGWYDPRTAVWPIMFSNRSCHHLQLQFMKSCSVNTPTFDGRGIWCRTGSASRELREELGPW